MTPRQKRILVNIVSYEKLVSDNLTQIAEMERHLKELRRMNKVFVDKMIELNKSYSER